MENKLRNRFVTLITLALCGCGVTPNSTFQASEQPALESEANIEQSNPSGDLQGEQADVPESEPDIVVIAPRTPKPAAPAAAPAKPAAAKPVAAKPAAAKPTPPKVEAQLPTNKLPIPAWASKTQSDIWTRATIKALKELGADLIKSNVSDAADYCPAYHRLNEENRAKVWVQLISSMAKFESGLNPIASYTEGFKGDSGKLVVSRGLLQISKGSANLYGCDIKKETDLENAETNLRCGVRIMNTLVGKYHAIHGLQADTTLRNVWAGPARYWSVLRRRAKDLLIRASVHQMSVCKA